jgi:hypothetical protein
VKEDQRPARADVGLQVQSDIVQLTQSAEPCSMDTTCAVSVVIEEEGALIFSAVKNPTRPSR